MTGEQDRIELGHRAAGVLLVENGPTASRRHAWVEYVAMVAGWETP